MEEQERFNIIRRLRNKVEQDGGNVLTLYCLIAVKTDEKLKDFEKEMTG